MNRRGFMKSLASAAGAASVSGAEAIGCDHNWETLGDYSVSLDRVPVVHPEHSHDIEFEIREVDVRPKESTVTIEPDVLEDIREQVGQTERCTECGEVRER